VIRLIWSYFLKNHDSYSSSSDFSQHDFERKIHQAKMNLSRQGDRVLAKTASEKINIGKKQNGLPLEEIFSYPEFEPLKKELEWGDGPYLKQILEQHHAYWGKTNGPVKWKDILERYLRYCQNHQKSYQLKDYLSFTSNELFWSQWLFYISSKESFFEERSPYLLTPFIQGCQSEFEKKFPHRRKESKKILFIIEEFFMMTACHLSREQMGEWLLEFLSGSETAKNISLVRSKSQIKEMMEHWICSQVGKGVFHGAVIKKLYCESFSFFVHVLDYVLKQKLVNLEGDEYKKLEQAYRVFSLPLFSSEEKVKKVFNKEAKRRHPDMVMNVDATVKEQEKVNDRFTQLKESYDEIRDYQKKRKEFFQLLLEWQKLISVQREPSHV
jgi:DnaJ-domain-containing protein 1